MLIMEHVAVWVHVWDVLSKSSTKAFVIGAGCWTNINPLSVKQQLLCYRTG